MNRVVVIRAAAGLAAYLHRRAAERRVVIGYDARHKSDVFARDTAAVMRGAGLRRAACCPARCRRRCSPSRSATSALPPA